MNNHLTIPLIITQYVCSFRDLYRQHKLFPRPISIYWTHYYIYLNMTLKKLILLTLYYFILDAKLLINHIKKFLRNFIDTKNLTKLFTPIDETD